MDSKPDPVLSVFSTPEVREMILEKLDSRSLVNCRLVCQSWSTTASSILRKMPVWIKQCWDSATFLLLYKCLGSSVDFPFTGLNLSLGHSSRHSGMDGQNTDKFFSRFGRHFTHVRIRMKYEWHSKIVDRWLSYTQKLMFLDIGDSLHCYTYVGASFRLHALRVLKVQNWSGSRAFLEEVIRAAPNLEKIEQFDCFTWIQMQGLVQDRSLSSLVSSMTLTCSQKYESVFSQLAANPPQLTALTVSRNGSSHRFKDALNIVLMENRNALKKIKFQGFHRTLKELSVFQNVEELNFGITRKSFAENAHVSAVFPTLSNSCFPKLKKVRLDVREKQITLKIIKEYFWQHCDSPLESVDELELESYCGKVVMEYLAKIFPHVTCVRLNYQKGRYGDKNVRRNPTDVWYLEAFPCLSKLDIRGFPIKPGGMDSFLTGIPLEIRTKFRKSPKQVVLSCCSEVLRSNSSILKLKNLKELTVVKLKSNPFMSTVSIWYALELLPGVHTSFLYCHKKNLLVHDDIEVLAQVVSPVKEYVTIGQCNCTEIF